jgi:alpha-amylase/alpha-mannosidase (GH57 family)
MRGTENDELAEKGYKPFLTNRSLSYHSDCIMYVNELNINHQIDSILQFDFLINSLRPRKRYSKWAKAESNSDLEIIMEYYGCNLRRAVDALNILDDNAISMIKEQLEKGGMKNERKNRRHG